MKRSLILILKFAVAAGLIVWLISSGKLDFSALRNVEARWPWLVAAQLPFALVLLCAAFRWLLLLRAQGMEYRFREVYTVYLIGWLFNQVTFGAAGGDAVRAYLVARDHPAARSAAVISVVADRVIGLFVLATVALVSLLVVLLTDDGSFAAQARVYLEDIAKVLVAIWIGGVVFLALFFSGAIASSAVLSRLLTRLPFRAALEKAVEVADRYRGHRGAVCCALGITVFIHVGVIITNILLLHALFPEPGKWGSLFFVIPVAHFLMAIPLQPPGALGTGEAIYDALFSWVGLSGGALTSLLQRFSSLSWAAVGLVLYLGRRRRVAGALDDARRAEAVDQASPQS
jgi:uncharacterized protein (TIRG00374 family)